MLCLYQYIYVWFKFEEKEGRRLLVQWESAKIDFQIVRFDFTSFCIIYLYGIGKCYIVQMAIGFV